MILGWLLVTCCLLFSVGLLIDPAAPPIVVQGAGITLLLMGGCLIASYVASRRGEP